MSDKKVNTGTLIKASFWYTISNFLTHAMAFITMPIYTRLMSKPEYGNFSVYASWQQILVIICGFEVHATLNRARFDYQNKKELDGYITSCLFLTTAITGLIFILYLAFPSIFDRWFLLERKYMLVMLIYLFTFPALSMFTMKQRIEYKYRLSATISFSNTILSSLIALFLVSSMDSDRLFGRILGQYSMSIIIGFVCYMLFVYNSTSIKTEYFKYAIRLGLPLVFNYLASRILLTSDTIVLKHMCSAEEVSNLSIAHSACQIVLLLIQAVNMSWAPWYFDMLRLKSYNQIQKVYRIYLLVVLVITSLVLLVGPEVIFVLGGNQYRDSVFLLPPYILCGIFTVFTSQFGYLETYYKKPEYAAVLTGVVAILNVILNIIGVSLFGYKAVCYATVLCQIILIILHYRVTKKMEIENILTQKTMMTILVSSAILIPLALVLYTTDLVRYMFVILTSIIALVFLYLKRSQIFELINKFKKSKNNGMTSEEEQNYE